MAAYATTRMPAAIKNQRRRRMWAFWNQAAISGELACMALCLLAFLVTYLVTVSVSFSAESASGTCPASTSASTSSDGQMKLFWSIESVEPIVLKMGSLLEASVTVPSPGEVPGCSQIKQASWWTGF